jgi:Carboxypeptidase regulatory-like domain/TonB dependent receptor/TonB-dependent Receptor Plug Domain
MKCPVLVVILLLSATVNFAQTESARISGRVTDLTGGVIVGAQCKIINTETDTSVTTTTNDDGIYVFPDLHPGVYRLTIQKDGFRTVVQPSLQLFVQDAFNENFTLAIGPVSESVTVLADTFGLRTDSAAVSTLVDDQFVQNMPLNGRSFQSLIALAPGLVVSSSATEGAGQFSINGQRSDANYITVDGVSANFSSAPSANLSQSLGGAIPGFTSGGGTNALVSVDAMREFRVQTSSYPAEFGRTPGGQISIVTKSGTNQFHGTAFDYLRNDIFDARNYFDAPPLPKPALRQNDFGGTVGGPILKDKTFFFFSYEGLRLDLPDTVSHAFYTASARAVIAPVYQPFIKAQPLPPPNAPLVDPTCDNITNPCMAVLTAADSNPSNFSATSIRVDHSLTKKVLLFVRYNHAPSYDAIQNFEEAEYDNVNTDTLTGGATIAFTPTKTDDFRANWSRSTGTVIQTLTSFDGGVPPPSSAFFPAGSPYGFATSQAVVAGVFDGSLYANVQRQLNFVNTFAWTLGVHQLRFGVDYRRLTPTSGGGSSYVAIAGFPELVLGNVGTVLVQTKFPYSVKINNYSLFAQDNWKVASRLTLNYGLRWEINPAPESVMSGRPLFAVQGIFDSNPLALVPGAPWHTQYGNFAPRIGVAYQPIPKTVIRGGFGLYYDLGYGNYGNISANFPYLRDRFTFEPGLGVPFDLSNPAFEPIPFSTTNTPVTGVSIAVDPNLQLPLTLQWNVAVEQELGTKQTFTATYLGADGRRLLREDAILPPALLGNQVPAIWNGDYSHYESLQLQFQRRMSQGLQALVSYTFAKSSDLGSNDGTGIYAPSVSQVVLPPLSPSDFDIRNSLAGALSYELPTPAWGRVGKAILTGWAVDGLVRASSAPPINVTAGNQDAEVGYHDLQANVVPGQPFWIADPTQPSGRALNPAAFSLPAAGIMGDFPRNSLRSPYSIDQTDLALRRRFNLTERLKLDVRAEYFNVFNHPMFGAPGFNEPNTEFGILGFGKIDTTTNNALGPGGTSGGQNPLYAVGGPRSAQFTLKLLF